MINALARLLQSITSFQRGSGSANRADKTADRVDLPFKAGSAGVAERVLIMLTRLSLPIELTMPTWLIVLAAPMVAVSY